MDYLGLGVSGIVGVDGCDGDNIGGTESHGVSRDQAVGESGIFIDGGFGWEDAGLGYIVGIIDLLGIRLTWTVGYSDSRVQLIVN